MKAIGKISLFVFVLVAPTFAQRLQSMGPPAAVSGVAYDVSFGYTYLTTSIPAAGRVNLNGLDASGRVDFNSRWGATVDSSYVRTSNVLGTGSGGYVLSLLAGPVFYPVEHGNTRILIRGLVGAGLVDSAVPVNNNSYLHGWVARYAYAVGGGIEHSLSGRFAVRVTGDYLRTAFVDPADVVQLQNNLRVTVGIVFRLKERHPN